MKLPCEFFPKTGFAQSLRPFMILHKIFGLAIFKYPSKSFDICRYASVSAALNLLFVIGVAAIMLLVDSSIHNSRVFVTGMKIIMKTTSMYCLIILVVNFIAGKQFFKFLKNFEKFDKSFFKETNQHDLLRKVNGTARTLLFAMWFFKNAYIFLIFSKRWSHVSFLLIVYEHSLIRMGDEQFVFFCYHLLQRIKILNSSTMR